MAFDPGPCGNQFEDWEDAFNIWKSKDGAAGKSIRRVGAGTAVGVGVCAATWWTGVGLVACAAAGATALYFDGESIHDSLERNDAYEDLLKAKAAYEKCVYDHKKYYGKDRTTNPI